MVIKMLKKTLPYLFAIIIGIIFGYYMFDGNIYLSNILNKSEYKAFQIGVYTDYTKANEIKNKYAGSILVKDEELYRVYYALLHNKNNINNMKKYMQEQNINYYIKDLEIHDLKVINEMTNIEELMQKSDNLLFLELNKKILMNYEVSINENKNLT